MRHDLALVSLLALTACADDGTGADTPVDGGATATDASADAAPAPTKRGWIDIRLEVDGFGSSSNTNIDGEFNSAQGACEHRAVGACEVDRCPVDTHAPLADPGKLTIPLPGGGQFGWEPGAFPIYFHADEIPWAAGELVRVSGAGADVPAFTASFPAPKTLDAGFDGPLSSQMLARTSALPVTWTPMAGEVVVMVEQHDDGILPRVDIRCTFPASAGAGSIPVDALSWLGVTPALYTTGDTRVQAWLATTSTVDAGDYRIRVRALRAYDDQYKRYLVR